MLLLPRFRRLALSLAFLLPRSQRATARAHRPIHPCNCARKKPPKGAVVSVQSIPIPHFPAASWSSSSQSAAHRPVTVAHMHTKGTSATPARSDPSNRTAVLAIGKNDNQPPRFLPPDNGTIEKIGRKRKDDSPRRRRAPRRTRTGSPRSRGTRRGPQSPAARPTVPRGCAPRSGAAAQGLAAASRSYYRGGVVQGVSVVHVFFAATE